MELEKNKSKCMICRKCCTVPLINSIYYEEGILKSSYTCECGRRNSKFGTLFYLLNTTPTKDVKIKQSIYCKSHKELQKKHYCVNCETLVCSNCDSSHSEHTLNDVLFNKDSFNQLKDDFTFASNSITSKINQEKESLLAQIEETITQLNNDKNRMLKFYEINKRNNNQLIQLVTLLFNNYEHSSENYTNYLNLRNWTKFNLSQMKTDANDDHDVNPKYYYQPEESNHSDRYYRTLTFKEKELNRRSRETNTKSLHQQVEQFVKNCTNCLILINIKKTYLSNLTIDYIKILQPIEEFPVVLESLIYFKGYTKTTNLCLELPNNKLAIVFTNYECIRVYDTSNYRCIKLMPSVFVHTMYNPRIMKLEDNTFVVYDGNEQNHFSLDDIDIYNLRSIKVGESIVKMLHTDNGYFILTSLSLFYKKYSYDKIYYLLLEFENNGMYGKDLMECCHGHLILNMTFLFLIVEIDNEGCSAIIYEHSKVENGISKMTSMDEDRIAFWIEDYIMIFNCDLFQTETCIKFMIDTGLNSNFCYVDGALIVTETNNLYIIDTENYICDRKYLFNKYYTIGNVIPLANRKIAIILNSEIIFFKY